MKEREFSIAEGVGYLVGAIGVQLTSITIVQWLPFFYTPPEDSGRVALISVGQMSVMMLIGRVMDAISDPVIGTLSDRTRSRWGRRRPYILFGNFPLALSFFLLWFPPVQGLSVKNFAYSTAVACLYWWLFTVVLVPLIALLPEMARSDKGRVALSVYWTWGMNLGLLIAFVLSSKLIEEVGYKLMGLVMSALSFLCFQFCASAIKERFPSDKPAQPFKLKELQVVVENRPFLIFAASAFLFNLGFYVIQMVLPYYNEVIMRGKEGDIAKYMMVYVSVSLYFANVFMLLSKRYSLKLLYGAGMLLMACFLPLMYLVGVYQGPIPREWLLMGMVALAGVPQASLYVFMGPLLGQCIDLDEKVTHQRREAIYSGVIGFIYKLAMSASSLVMWGLFKFGYSHQHPTGILLTGPVCGLIAALGFLIFLSFPRLDRPEGGNSPKS